MWRNLMIEFGVQPGDYIVASEPYGQKLADITKARFYQMTSTATLHALRQLMFVTTLAHFEEILPEFQQYLRTTVTVFGAESTGKTTLSRQLAKELNGHWLFEYARPYLENTVNEITVRSMQAIHRGQVAMQKHALDLHDKPYIIQDTDLFSTVGYWQFPHWQQTYWYLPRTIGKRRSGVKI